MSDNVDEVFIYNASLTDEYELATDETKKEPFFAYGCYKGQKEIGRYSVRDLKGFAPFEKEFNYALWLSGKDDYRLTGEF